MKNTTSFYFIQWLIIGNIATAIYQTQTLSSFTLWFAGIFAITVLITWFVGRIVKSKLSKSDIQISFKEHLMLTGK